MQKIIINCSECGKQPTTRYLEDEKFQIKCCDQIFQEESEEETVNKWNQENNIYEHIFGIKFETDIENDKVTRYLDGLVIFDEIQKEESKIFQNLMNNQLISCTLSELSDMFPECMKLAQEINGIVMRHKAHLPSYKLYRFSFSEELGREDINILIQNLNVSDLKKYECGINLKNKGIEDVFTQQI